MLQLVVNLVKSGKKGSTWKKHKYLIKILLPDGSERYVYPKKHDLKTENESGQFVLNRPVAQIINDALLGGATGRVDKETGEPEVADGLFYTYDVVMPGTKAFEDAKKKREWMKQHGHTVGEADGYEKVNGWRVYRYRKVPGFVDIDVHPHITGALGYKLPQKILELQLKTSEEISQAHDLMGGAIPEGGTPSENETVAKQDTATPPTGTVSIHSKPVQSEATKEVLALDLGETEEVDPLITAQKLKKLVTLGMGKKVKPFPQWVLDKFKNEQELMDKLQKQPVTTLITLGVYKPTARSTKLNNRLQEEWTPLILGMARDDFDAYKVTKLYQKWQEKDEAAGIDHTSPDSKVRKFRLSVTSDLLNNGLEKLLTIAREYEPSQRWDDRFDKYAYTAIDNELSSRSKKEAERNGVFIPIVADEDVDVMAHKQGAQIIITPEEATELKMLTGPAKAALFEALNDKDMPESYRRVFLARLWLDDVDPSKPDKGSTAEEWTKIENRKESGSPRPKNWHRDFTGEGSIVEKYNEWTDPDTGKLINLGNLSQSSQWRYLNEWYGQAQAAILRHLSEPSTRDDEPGDRVNVVSNTVLSEDEALVQAALGINPKFEQRTLTDKGKMVKRWLQLEAKVAESNRRTFTESEHHDVTHMNLKRDKVPPSSIKMQMIVPPKGLPSPAGAPINVTSIPNVRGEVHPAVAFFTDTHNQHLARRLGLRLESLDPSGSGGVFKQPNVSMGSLAQRHLNAAEQYHNVLLKIQKTPHKRLVAQLKESNARQEKLQALGSWKSEKGVAVWNKGKTDVTTLHDAALAVQTTGAALAARSAAYRAAYQDYKSTGLSREEILKKVKHLKPTKKEIRHVEKTLGVFHKLIDSVGDVAPRVAETYSQAIEKREPVGDHHLQGARALLAQAQRDARNTSELIEFEQKRRAAAASMTKSTGTIVDLFKALTDYDFALGRLHAELNHDR